MKNLTEYVNEAHSISGKTLKFTVDDKLCIPVMVASRSGQLAWELEYLVARDKGEDYGLFLIPTPDYKWTNNPLDQSTDYLVPVDRFDFDKPKVQKFDFRDAILDLGISFTKGQEVEVKL